MEPPRSAPVRLPVRKKRHPKKRTTAAKAAKKTYSKLTGCPPCRANTRSKRRHHKRSAVDTGPGAPVASLRWWLLLRLHPETQLVAVKVRDIEVTHAVRIVFRLVWRSGASRLQLL